MRSIVIAFLAIPLAIAAAGCGNASGNSIAPPPAARAPAPAPTSTAALAAEPVEPLAVPAEAPAPTGYPVAGTLRARRTTRVASQVSGRVLEVLVDVGDAVKAGDPLVRLDPKLYDFEVRERAAELAAAKAAKDEADLHRKRLQDLWNRPPGERPLIARHEVDQAELRAAGAAAKVQLAEELLAHAKERLEETVIRAPYAGIVTARFVDPGAMVVSPPVTEMIEVQETGVLYLEFALPQTLAGAVERGMRVEFRADGVSGARTGEVALVFPAVDEATRSLKARVIVENPDGALRPGLLVDVQVATNGALAREE